MNDCKISHLIKKAWDGDVDAQYLVGCYFLEGKYVYPDDSETIDWWSKAADGGHLISMYHLGVFYHNDRSLDPNYERSIFWLSKSASFGCHDAKILLQQIKQETLKDNHILQ